MLSTQANDTMRLHTSVGVVWWIFMLVADNEWRKCLWSVLFSVIVQRTRTYVYNYCIYMAYRRYIGRAEEIATTHAVRTFHVVRTRVGYVTRTSHLYAQCVCISYYNIVTACIITSDTSTRALERTKKPVDKENGMQFAYGFKAEPSVSNTPTSDIVNMIIDKPRVKMFVLTYMYYVWTRGIKSFYRQKAKKKKSDAVV